MNVEDLLNVPAPWAAVSFQTKRNGTRYYCDPLPGCDIAPATDKTWPGFSSLKPSKPFRKNVPWIDERTGEVTKRAVPLDLARAWAWLEQQADIDVTSHAFRQQFLTSARRQMDIDTMRGSAIHAYAEAILTDAPVPAWVAGVEAAAPYLEHVAAFIEERISTPLGIEQVIINRTAGYGGTGDLWCELADGRTAYVDWKSRGGDSAHACYEEEVAQGGAYTSAEYRIVPSADGTAAVRALPVAATVGVVVSLRPDGWEAHEYDLTAAGESFNEMRAAYVATSNSGKRARAARRGRPVHTAEVAAVDPQIVRDGLQARIDRLKELDMVAVRRFATALQVAEIPTLKQSDRHTAEQLETMGRLLADAERPVLSFGEHVDDTPPALRAPADEGATVTASDRDEVRAMFARLDEHARRWVLSRATEGKDAGVSFVLAEKATRRRWSINLALIACTAVGDDDVVRELAAAVTGGDWALMPGHPLGHIFGVLAIDEADDLADLATRLAAHMATGAPIPLEPATGRIDTAALAA